MSNEEKGDESLSALLEYFADRLNRVFAYFFCTLEFESDSDHMAEPSKNDRCWALLTIRTACLHTTLLALRDLDDFLAPGSKPKPSDLRATDFGFTNTARFLTKTERNVINQNIAHTTLPGATAQLFRWDVFELATKGIRQASEYLAWVEQHYGIGEFLTFTAALACRTRTQAIYDHFAKKIQAAPP